MKVRLTGEWLGHSEGSVLDLVPRVAESLLARGAAESVVNGADHNNDKLKKKSDSDTSDSQHPGQAKVLRSAVKDKMVKGPQIDK